MKLWRYEWASLEIALAVGAVALLVVVYIGSRVVGWILG